MTRVITGLILAAAVVAVLLRAPVWLVWLCLVTVGGLTTDEVRRILAQLGRAPWPLLAFFGTYAVMATFLVRQPPLVPVLAVVLTLSLFRALFPTQEPAQGIDRVLGTLTTVLYVGLTLGHLGGMFPLDASPAERTRAGYLVLLLVAAVYFGDTAALYGGKTFGRHKLAPGVSPSKTWEGAVFGLAGSVLAGVATRVLFLPEIPTGTVALLAFVLGVVGILGDLSESLLKRAAGVKDSGSLLPGHGGMFDRVDSLLLAAPVLYWFQRLLPS